MLGRNVIEYIHGFLAVRYSVFNYGSTILGFASLLSMFYEHLLFVFLQAFVIFVFIFYLHPSRILLGKKLEEYDSLTKYLRINTSILASFSVVIGFFLAEGIYQLVFQIAFGAARFFAVVGIFGLMIIFYIAYTSEHSLVGKDFGNRSKKYDRFLVTLTGVGLLIGIGGTSAITMVVLIIVVYKTIKLVWEKKSIDRKDISFLAFEEKKKTEERLLITWMRLGDSPSQQILGGLFMGSIFLLVFNSRFIDSWKIIVDIFTLNISPAVLLLAVTSFVIFVSYVYIKKNITRIWYCIIPVGLLFSLLIYYFVNPMAQPIGHTAHQIANSYLRDHSPKLYHVGFENVVFPELSFTISKMVSGTVAIAILTGIIHSMAGKSGGFKDYGELRSYERIELIRWALFLGIIFLVFSYFINTLWPELMVHIFSKLMLFLAILVIIAYFTACLISASNTEEWLKNSTNLKNKKISWGRIFRAFRKNKTYHTHNAKHILVMSILIALIFSVNFLILSGCSPPTSTPSAEFQPRETINEGGQYGYGIPYTQLQVKNWIKLNCTVYTNDTIGIRTASWKTPWAAEYKNITYVKGPGSLTKRLDNLEEDTYKVAYWIEEDVDNDGKADLQLEVSREPKKPMGIIFGMVVFLPFLLFLIPPSVIINDLIKDGFIGK